jgi:UDP-N-acetylmuramoyl-tripeptide--D-alanyl-D-alanine ligase
LLSHILESTKKVRAQSIKNGVANTVKTLGALENDEACVVLEIGTAGPGQIAEAAKFVRPDVAIVTLVALEHYSVFRNLANVAKEKSSLVKALPPDGLAILNKDDPNVLAMAQSTSARVVTFGKQGADYEQADIDARVPGALALTLKYSGKQLRLKTRLTGAHNCLAVSAAAACALELGIPEAAVINGVASFDPVFGRLTVHKINYGPTFLLDTLKAPYHSLSLALDTLRSSTATRKRLVLGNISDYQGNPFPKYRDTYRAAAAIVDQVIIVGPNSHRSGATKDDIESKRLVTFVNVEDASRYIKATAVEDELILVKGSGNLHLERIFLDFETGVQCWPNDCGIKVPCTDCGLFRHPFYEHSGKVPRRANKPWARTLLVTALLRRANRDTA